MLKVQMLAVLAAAVLAVAAVTTLRSNDAASEPAPDDVRTVTVRNDCSDPVWLFYGLDPPQRPQDALPLAGDTATAQPMLEGDTIWLLDDGGIVHDHASVAASTDTIVIGTSCTTMEAADR